MVCLQPIMRLAGMDCYLILKIVFYRRRTQFSVHNSASTILRDGLGMFNFAFMQDVGNGYVSLDPYTLFECFWHG